MQPGQGGRARGGGGPHVTRDQAGTEEQQSRPGPELGGARPTPPEKPPVPCSTATQQRPQPDPCPPGGMQPGVARSRPKRCRPDPIRDMIQNLFPTRWAGLGGPTTSRLQPRAQGAEGQNSGRRQRGGSGDRLERTVLPPASPFPLAGLRASRCVRAPGARSPTGDPSPGRSGPRGGGGGQLQTPPRPCPGPAHGGGHSPISGRGEPLGWAPSGGDSVQAGRGARGAREGAPAGGGQPPPRSGPRLQTKEPRGAGAGVGGHGARGRGAGVTLPPAAPFNSGPAPARAPRPRPANPPARPPAPPAAGGRRGARGQWAARGAGRARAGGSGAANRGRVVETENTILC